MASLTHVGWLPLVLSCLTVLAETPAISPVIKSPGDIVTLEIAATSQPKRAPIVLHFDVVFPAQLMAIEGAGKVGSAAQGSGKSLECHILNPHSYGCVISGGQNPMADGQIAIFHFRILKTAKPGTTALRVERAVSTTADGKVVSLNDTEAAVIIR